jgi:RND family efflux transporter MFP subunit
MMENMKKLIIPAAILITGFILMSILLNMKEEKPKRETKPIPRIVEVERVELESVPSSIEAFGTLTSAQPVVVYSEVAGILMKGDIPFQPAQSFRKGDVLIKIDDRQIKLDLNSTKSDFLNALATVLPEIKVDFPDEYKLFQNYFNRAEFDKPLDKLPEVKNQKIKLFLSRYNVYKLYFAVQNLEIKLEKHYIKAPFDGSIVTADLRVGSNARVGTRLGEIINLENMEVEIPVPAIDVKWIDYSKKVIFTSEILDGSWTGKIIRTGRSIDNRTQTVPVYIAVDNARNSGLVAGTFFKAFIPGKRIEDAVRIPRKSLYKDEYIYLIKNGKLDLRKVNVSRKETNSVIVNSGIQTGDTLVVELLQGVAPGMPAIAKSTIVGTN